jgi:hypothetical protein
MRPLESPELLRDVGGSASHDSLSFYQDPCGSSYGIRASPALLLTFWLILAAVQSHGAGFRQVLQN